MSRFRLGRAQLSHKGWRWHQSGHPWVYRDDIESLDPGQGHLVEVFDSKGRRLGLASHSPESRIALRFLRRGPEAEIPDRRAFFAEVLTKACDRRLVLDGETDAMRLVSSEADGMPGLIVDRYGEVLVLQALTPFQEEHLDHIVPWLVERFDPTMVLARHDARVRRLEGLPLEVSLLHGRAVPKVGIREHGIAIEVDPFKGQKTGWFLDQRPARARFEALAGGGGAVLDLCSYNGGFSLHARRGGAGSVLAVDQSQEALSSLERNGNRNGLDGIETRRGNVFQVVKELLAEGRRFQGIVLDPPAFAKSRREVDGALRGYLDLNSRSLRLLEPGGWLLTCSCSYNITAPIFHEMLREAAARAGVQVLDRGRISPGLDHPILLGLPESDYLKSVLLERI